MRKLLIAKDLVRVCSSPYISLFTWGGGSYTSLHSQRLTNILTSETADLKETQDVDLIDSHTLSGGTFTKEAYVFCQL